MSYSAVDVRNRKFILRMLLVSPPKSGKAQPVDEPVLTPTGWRPIGSLQIGDQVIGSNGQAISITGVFPQGKKEVVSVITDDGSTTRCCRDHLWYTTNRNELFRGRYTRPYLGHMNGKRICMQERVPTGNVGKGSVKSTTQIQSTLGDLHYLPRLSGPVNFTSIDSDLLDPYYLGLLLGDGTFCVTAHSSLEFTSMDNELFEFIENHCKKIGDFTTRYDYADRCPGIRIKGETTRYALNLYGLMRHRSSEKFIPERYFFSSVEDRLSLLRGLCDTDGTVSPGGVQAEYSTSSPKLKDGVVELVRSLGGRVLVRNKHTPCLPAYSCMISFDDGTCPFKMRRKAELWGKRERFWRCRIVDIRCAGEAECVCIKVDSEDQLYVTKDYMLTHNTCAAVLTSPGPVYVINSDGQGALDPVALLGGEFEAEDVNSMRQFDKCLSHLKVNKDKYKTIVLDNISSFGDFLEEELTSEGIKDGRQFYPELKKRLMYVIRSLLALPQNVIVIGQCESDGSAKGGFGHILNISGKAKISIPSMFQDWVWLDVQIDPATKEVKREFLLAPQGNWTKGVRSIKDTSSMEANISKFIRLAEKRNENTNPVQKSNGTTKPAAQTQTVKEQTESK